MGKGIFSRLAFWQKSNIKLNVGIYVCPDKVVACHQVFENKDENIFRYDTKEFAFDGVNWSSLFSNLAKEFGSSKLQITLSSPYYQLLLVDRPNVESDEMNQALLWSVKDMISQAVTDVHIDYFEPPQLNSAKLSVVIVDKKKTAAMVLAAKDHEMQVVGINIEEMAVTNLFLEDPLAKLIISHLSGQEILLTVVKQGELYMQRRVRGFNQIDTVSAEELSFGMADNLSLELQRSMDFFESQQRQAPVSSIELLINGHTEKLAELIGVNFNQEVNVIAVESVESKMAYLALIEMRRNELDVAGVQV
ncbi:MSHA biogenesis protein MshI [Shewanella sp. D64]|uniref:MSHA biogenesis protein MshI n=1 Tax=unclassified Shewanella TaxID=196818 RepID=UPI0022BA71B6|nr:MULTISPECIES: MSHA biogenesis protein MshI [unclassified Shewanella]MEC4725436.1 MSHA biogenesis protein MshI [Shewanella sp. D64]MEC4738747.1 MSHA biogenesis protein MshI [Shewanella sp. E94]WBJ98294.1 MSHA biogenesis protein MshI [Shewanella sp. MTB7]